MEKAGLTDPFLTQLQRGIDEQRFGSGDDQGLRAFLDQACLDFAAGLKATVVASSDPKS